jgi:hypothetical protein
MFDRGRDDVVPTRPCCRWASQFCELFGQSLNAFSWPGRMSSVLDPWTGRGLDSFTDESFSGHRMFRPGDGERQRGGGTEILEAVRILLSESTEDWELERYAGTSLSEK